MTGKQILRLEMLEKMKRDKVERLAREKTLKTALARCCFRCGKCMYSTNTSKIFCSIKCRNEQHKHVYK